MNKGLFLLFVWTLLLVGIVGVSTYSNIVIKEKNNEIEQLYFEISNLDELCFTAMENLETEIDKTEFLKDRIKNESEVN